MIEIQFHPDVEQEINSAYLWYESQAQGLGEDLLHELEHGFISIQNMPQAWSIIATGFRRYLLKKFPYGVIYQIRQKSILIVAVMHLNRKPEYWKNRKV